MRIELMPGLDNVFRFPTERRVPPTLELLYEIMPDAREVFSVAEAFGIEAPDAELYARADLATAERILSEVPREPCSVRRAMLAEMRQALIVAAVEACRAAHDAGAAATEAHHGLLVVETRRGWRGDVDDYRAEANRLTYEAAERLIMAHVATEQARGGVRAIELARRDEPWTPRAPHDEAMRLFGERAAG